MTTPSTQERFKRGAVDAGHFYTYIASFVGFDEEDIQAIRAARFIIEKHIPQIVGAFYAHLLRFPATRKPFLKRDGSIDQAYLEMRMQHQVGFWRRAAAAQFDEDFARFTDYVGRAHTSHGADTSVYIPQRYVIGMVGFVQRHIAEALHADLHAVDPDLEQRAVKAWNAFTMVLLEMFSRPYVQEGEAPAEAAPPDVDEAQLMQLALNTYERGLGIARSISYQSVLVGAANEIPDGQRKLIQVGDLSIGVFHHLGTWVALQNSCLHRGGPVCTGTLVDNTLTCPWHGYQYDVRTGQLLLDPSAYLNSYPVEIRAGNVYVTIPAYVSDNPAVDLNQTSAPARAAASTGGDKPMSELPVLKDGEFRLAEVQPGQAKRVQWQDKDIAVYNVEGQYYATDDTCTHAGGPLSEGRLEGMNIICPWHDSCFNVSTGAVTCKPAKKPVQAYRVVVADGMGRIDAALPPPAA